MCGIIGIIGKNYPKERIKLSLEKVPYRGLELYETKDLGNAGLGINRLPIVGRENGVNPLANEDETIFAVMNGEIFNYLELKKELEALGHIFRSESDTEVLVHLYEEYGENFLKKLDSELFAFVVFDTKTGKVLAARDPIGVKPLYYANDKAGNLYFASELKQLAGFDDIDEISDFPPGHYHFDGKFVSYFDLAPDKTASEKGIEDDLASLVDEAVRKRVATDLPIGVFLSGGVDSSLVMELANRFHKDVTAFVLGTPESGDYKAAMTLCEEKGYKYVVVRPDKDYLESLDDLLYHIESFEPNIIRHAFANHMLAKEARKRRFRIVLVGEGSDEIFAGYNEFADIDPRAIGKVSVEMTKDLANSQLKRVDRMTMWETLEARSPFLDVKVVDLAMKIPADLKIRHQDNGPVTKYLIRKVAARYLPDYIAWRYKEPFALGAGMKIGNHFLKSDGEIAELIAHKDFNVPSKSEIEKYGLRTREEMYYYEKFKEFGYNKLGGAENRILVRDTLAERYPKPKNPQK